MVHNTIVHDCAILKIYNTTKSVLTYLTIKNETDGKNQKEDKKSSCSYDIEAVDFLDNINFKNTDFDDNDHNYIEEYI